MNRCSLINNPVLGVPWKKRHCMMENPLEALTKARKAEQDRLYRAKLRISREEKVSILQSRFPSLAKCHARAALTISKHNLQRAIVFCEISRNCQEIVEKCDQLANIQMNLIYKNTIVVEQNTNASDDGSSNNTNPAPPNSVEGENSLDSSKSSSTSSNGKVGVLITKTNGGYRSTML